MIKEKLDNKTIKRILLGLFVITVITFAFLMIKDTHAYYNYSTGPIPIFTGKVGNFAGKGDTSPLTDRTTDVNLLYYIQNGLNLRKYDVYDTPPLDVKSNYVLNEEMSNCIPKESNGVTYPTEYSINPIDGEVTIKITENKPYQVVCRIYYSFNLTPYEEKDGDIKIITYIESDTGDIVTVRNNKYYIIGDIPSGYTMSYYECDNKDRIQTSITYDETNGFMFKTTGKNICHAYFDKAS